MYTGVSFEVVCPRVSFVVCPRAVCGERAIRSALRVLPPVKHYTKQMLCSNEEVNHLSRKMREGKAQC